VRLLVFGFRAGRLAGRRPMTRRLDCASVSSNLSSSSRAAGTSAGLQPLLSNCFIAVCTQLLDERVGANRFKCPYGLYRCNTSLIVSANEPSSQPVHGKTTTHSLAASRAACEQAKSNKAATRVLCDGLACNNGKRDNP